jgi:phosphate transport system protein
MLSMGELTLASIAHSLDCLLKKEGANFEGATELESKIDDWNRLVHDQALKILVLQSPVAGDARLVTGILESIIDLEQIGDYAYEVSGLALGVSRRPTAQLLSQVVNVGERIRDMLMVALDGYHLDRAEGPSIRSKETLIHNDCHMLSEKLYQLTAVSGDTQIYVNLILILKHFERMARHIVSVAEQAASAAPAGR